MNDEKIDFTLENRLVSVGGLSLSFRPKGRSWRWVFIIEMESS